MGGSESSDYHLESNLVSGLQLLKATDPDAAGSTATGQIGKDDVVDLISTLFAPQLSFDKYDSGNLFVVLRSLAPEDLAKGRELYYSLKPEDEADHEQSIAE